MLPAWSEAASSCTTTVGKEPVDAIACAAKLVNPGQCGKCLKLLNVADFGMRIYLRALEVDENAAADLSRLGGREASGAEVRPASMATTVQCK